jgi:hypothetical protein
MSLRPRAKLLPLPLVSILTVVPAAYAETLSYGIDAGIGESDNVTLVSTDKISETIAISDVDFALQQQSRLLDADLKGDFTYFDYLENAYGSQLIGRFDGLGKLALIPERLTWVLQDDFGQAQLDPYTPVTPNNLENINYVSTGPDLSLRMGGTGFVNASARYAQADYETSPFNSNRLLGSLAGGLQLSANSSLSLNGDSERVLFENTVINTNFDRSSAYVHYEAHGARTDLAASLGATEVRQGDSTTTGPLATVRLVRTLSPSAKLTVSAGRELTDPATSFSTIQNGVISALTTAVPVLTTASYTSTSASAGWNYERNRTKVNLAVSWEKDRYVSQPQFDSTRALAQLSIERQLTHDFSVELLGHLFKTDYPHGIVTELNGVITGFNSAAPTGISVGTTQIVSSDQDSGQIGAALTWRHGRWLEIRLRVDHNSQTVTGFGFGYVENQVFVTVGYRPRPSTDALAPN